MNMCAFKGIVLFNIRRYWTKQKQKCTGKIAQQEINVRSDLLLPTQKTKVTFETYVLSAREDQGTIESIQASNSHSFIYCRNRHPLWTRSEDGDAWVTSRAARSRYNMDLQQTSVSWGGSCTAQAPSRRTTGVALFKTNDAILLSFIQ